MGGGKRGKSHKDRLPNTKGENLRGGGMHGIGGVSIQVRRRHAEGGINTQHEEKRDEDRVSKASHVKRSRGGTSSRFT